MFEFSEGKFILRRELFLTKSSVNRVEKSIPFCDRGVFRMFISSTASCTYNKVCFSVTFIIMKLPMLVADIRISGARSVPYISRRHWRPRSYNNVYFPAIKKANLTVRLLSYGFSVIKRRSTPAPAPRRSTSAASRGQRAGRGSSHQTCGQRSRLRRSQTG